MSKLTDHISALKTNDCVAIARDIYALSSMKPFGNALDAHIGSQYKIGVQVEAQAVIASPVHDDALLMAVDSTKRHVIEAIFGEFRPLLIEAELAIWAGKLDEARDILATMRRQMFGSAT